MYHLSICQPKDYVLIYDLENSDGSKNGIFEQEKKLGCYLRRIGYFFSANKGDIIKVELIPITKARRFLSPEYATFFKLENFKKYREETPKRIADVFHCGVLDRYSNPTTQNSILVIEDFKSPEVSKWLQRNIRVLRDSNTFCAIRDSSYDCDEHDRIKSFHTLNQKMIPERRYPSVDAEMLGREGYFFNGDTIECCGCRCEIELDKFYDLLGEISQSMSADNSRYLTVLNEYHDERSKEILKHNGFYYDSNIYGQTTCLRHYPAGKSFISKDMGDHYANLQRYQELQIYENGGESEVKPVPGTFLIPTSKQQVRILQHPYPVYELTQLRRVIDHRFKELTDYLDSMENESDVNRNKMFIRDVYQKRHVLIKLIPSIKQIHDCLTQWQIKYILQPNKSGIGFFRNRLEQAAPSSGQSSGTLHEAGEALADVKSGAAGNHQFYEACPDEPGSASPTLSAKAHKELLDMEAISNLYPQEKAPFKQLLQDLLNVINTFNFDGFSKLSIEDASVESRGCEHLVQQEGLAFLLQTMVPPFPLEIDAGASRSTLGAFQDSETINRSTIETGERILAMLNETVLTPVRFLLGDDYWQLSEEIRQKIFLEPAIVSPPAKKMKIDSEK